MKTIFQVFVRITDGLTVLTGWLAALCLVAAAFIVTEAVIVRKLLGISTIWQIEASVFLLIFTVFVGAPFVQKNEHHLNVDLVIIHLSPRAREITLIVVSIFSCILTAVLAWYAWPMWWETGHQQRTLRIVVGSAPVDTLSVSTPGYVPAVPAIYRFYLAKN